jgi:hypothetical protein
MIAVPIVSLVAVVLAALVLLLRRHLREMDRARAESLRPVETSYVAAPEEPAPLPTPADLDPQVELADLLARANKMAGGRYLAINVGPSRKERRAEKAIARRAKR